MLNTLIQKSFIILIAFFLTLLLCANELTHADIVEDFSGMSGAKFSDDLWKTRNGDPAKIYSLVDEDGNAFLRARAEGISIQLFRKKGWNIKENPVLSWKWRVNEFPSGAQIKNDNPVAI